VQAAVFVSLSRSRDNLLTPVYQKPWQSIDTCSVNFLPFYKRLEEKGKKWRIKWKTMVQWINLWYNSFVKYMMITFVAWKNGAITLALPSVIAGQYLVNLQQNSSHCLWQYKPTYFLFSRTEDRMLSNWQCFPQYGNH